MVRAAFRFRARYASRRRDAGRHWLNGELADYVVPVNADIVEIDVGFIDRPDPLLNSIGAKA